jgi:hypothetical protein
MITRRRFLLGGLGALVLAGAGIIGFGRPALEAEIVAILRRRLDYLKLDDEGLHAYARDQVGVLLAKRPSLGRLRYHFVSAVGPTFKRFMRSTDTRSRMERMGDMFVSTYLISSDFFTNGSDESRIVRYVGFYDPMVRPCGSPFSRPMLANPA